MRMKNSFVNVFGVLVSISVICYFTAGCRSRSGEPTKTPRDTTITKVNAYTPIFIDSLKLEKFLASDVTSDTIKDYMRNFYNARNYSTAWFDEHGLTTQAQGFWSAHNNVAKQSTDSGAYEREFHQLIDTLLNSDSIMKQSENLTSTTELAFTKHFFEYVQHVYQGKVDPATVQWNIPRRKLDAVSLLDTVLSSKAEEWKSLNRAFRSLQNELFRFRKIEQNGGWATIPAGKKKFRQGDSDTLITAIKKRLNLAGLYESTDTLSTYTEPLKQAVTKAQVAFGLKPNGIIDAALIRQLNVPVGERMKQMLLNLERMKWMPELPDNYLLANIPEYRLHIIENSKEVSAMDIVVGKAANRTVIFSDMLKYIVFSPYWNVPQSIVRNEIAPAIKRNSNYLARNNMEVTGSSGGLPVVRQKPGRGNALGKVKFIFPNKYNIYFHDTPSKGLFSQQQRAFSHGCIRLHEPFNLAAYLLRNKPEWTASKITSAMNQSTEKWLQLDQPVPVFITYFTCWVDGEGLLHFADDVYGHDKTLADHLFND